MTNFVRNLRKKKNTPDSIDEQSAKKLIDGEQLKGPISDPHKSCVNCNRGCNHGRDSVA
jgi:hypothetical protein